MSASEELLKLPVRGENPYVKEWKDRVGHVIGYIRGYVPEEVIWACGMRHTSLII